MYHVHVQSMKLVRRLHARSMLRWHAVFWRHAQTVALAAEDISARLDKRPRSGPGPVG